MTDQLLIDGKRLLVLGGLAQNLVIIEKAKKLGCHVTVVDYLEDSPGKLIADDHYLISITDVERIVELCRKHGYDGIMNYCIDPGQKPYHKVCEALGYPCYGEARHFEILTNKDLFYNVCVENGVGVVPRYDVDFNRLCLRSELVAYPIIVKPADGRSSKGISVCNSETDVKTAIEIALKYSSRRKVVVEQFMEHPEVCAKYFVCDGVPYLTSFSDTYTGFYNGERTAINGKFYPSKFYGQFKVTADSRIRQMIKNIGIKNGPLSFTGFYSGDDFHFFDPSFRLGGAQQWRIEAHLTGVDASEALTRFALTGNCGLAENAQKLETDFSKRVAGQLFILVRAGVIGAMRGINEALNVEGVIGHYFNHDVGGIVSQQGTTDHVVVTIHMVADNKADLIHQMIQVQDTINILDKDGDSMLLPKFDVNML